MGPWHAMLYPAYSRCETCNTKHLYIAFTPSQLAFLKERVGRHKEKMARKTLKCIKSSLEVRRDRNGKDGRFRCDHCDNEYIAVRMSDPELKYLKQILGHIWCPCNGPVPDGDSSNHPTDDGSRINDSIIHRLVGVLYMPPIKAVDHIFRDHSRDETNMILSRYPDMHIRVWDE